MFHVGVNWRMRTQRAAWALSALALPLVLLGGSVAYAQSIMRTPSLNLGSRVPTINPTVTSRVNPVVGTRVNPVTGGRLNTVTVNRPVIANRPNTGVIARIPPTKGGGGPTTVARIPNGRPEISRVGVDPLPYPRYSHNLYPVCEYANRGPDGECFDRPVVVSTGGGGALLDELVLPFLAAVPLPPPPVETTTGRSKHSPSGPRLAYSQTG